MCTVEEEDAPIPINTKIPRGTGDKWTRPELYRNVECGFLFCSSCCS
jgi:hypothetical protein